MTAILTAPIDTGSTFLRTAGDHNELTVRFERFWVSSAMCVALVPMAGGDIAGWATRLVVKMRADRLDVDRNSLATLDFDRQVILSGCIAASAQVAAHVDDRPARRLEEGAR
ncbi:hypothetical protein [Amycolatopsis palatopharyngis]|uniref:hypothetical protein n=1 Tax=Amycolatopsis palatopharyngis TaxID=187982 RepID=UPI0013BE97E6|nr:hypothetical protein [Amycolatopsis palatopharyngis]